MPLALLFSRDKPELTLIKAKISDLLDFQISDQWEIHSNNKINSFLELLNNHNPNLCCLDITGEHGIALAEKTRKMHDETLIVVIVDETVSPFQYMKPGILAAGILLRPIKEKQAQKMLREVIDYIILQEREKAFADEVFSIENKDKIIRIAYAKIMYFEARDKKIYLCTKNEEWGFYSSLAALETILPVQFIRCHKGFIINSKLVDRLLLSNNLVELTGGISIPVSRGYREKVKGVLT